MATKTNDYAQKITATVNNAVGDLQNRAKAAYDKSTGVMNEMSDFAKGNVEAMVESGKIFAGGVEAFGKNYVADTKSAYATLSADMKEIAAVKSPTELFQLQGKIARRNFDVLVATTTKNNEVMIKLANETFAPISGRVNVATAKLSKAA